MVLQLKNPEMLWTLIGWLVLATWFVWVTRSHWQAKRLRTILTGLGLLACCLGLCRPQGGRFETSQTTRQSNLFVAIDISRSMLVQDVLPNRMGFSIAFSNRLLGQLSDFRVAVFPFTDDGYALLPLTSDKVAAMEMIATLGPSFASNQSTNLDTTLRSLYENIQRAKRKAEETGRDWSGAQTLVLSDGESHAEVSSSTIALYRKDNIPVFTIGVGRPNGGPVPMDDRPVSSVGLLRDGSGKMVVSRPDLKLMTRIAEGTGGQYFDADMQFVPAVVESLARHAKFGKYSMKFVPQLELYPYLFAFAFFLFVVEMLFSRWEFALRTILFLGLITQSVAWADEKVDPKSMYNTGIDAKDAKNLEKAAENFLDSATSTKDPNVKKKAYFALGNTYLRMGDPAQALQAYQQAYDTVARDQDFESEANSRISENMALAARVQQQMQSQSKSDKQSKDGKGESQDPKKPQKFEAQQLSEEQKKKVYDLALSEEQQTLQRLRDQKSRKSSSGIGKPW